MPAVMLAAGLASVAVALPLGDLAEGLDLPLAIAGVDDLVEAPAEQGVLRAAADLRERPIDALEAAVQRDERHADPAVVEGLAEALLGLSQGGLGRLPLADVADEGVKAPLLALAQGGDGELNRYLGAVAAQAIDHEQPCHDGGLRAREEAAQRAQVGVPVPPGEDRLNDRAPQDLLAAPAEEPLRLRIPLPDQIVLVDR